MNALSIIVWGLVALLAAVWVFEVVGAAYLIVRGMREDRK